jgi:lysophospholipase
LVLIHGTSEHGGRYGHVAKAAAEEGWEVIIPDLRGHGQSGGVPVHINRFERYLKDLDTLWQFFELNPTRTVVMGHSFGGLISIRYAETRPNRMASLVALSPLLELKVKINPLTWMLGRLTSIVRPTTRFESRVPVEHTTRNEDALADREDDPLVHRSVTAAWFFEMQRAIRSAWLEARNIKVPVLAMQAGADLIVEAEAVEPWLQLVGNRDRTFRWFDDHYHELLNETDWRRTLGSIFRWLNLRLPCEFHSEREWLDMCGN